MTGRSWLLVVDWLGRPHLANAERRAHYRTNAAKRAEWREAGAQAARLAKVPALERVAVTVQARYGKGRLSDPDACAPSVKGLIDGLVDAGVIPDDTGEHLASVTYLAARLERGRPDALVVRVEELTGDGAA